MNRRKRLEIFVSYCGWVFLLIFNDESRHCHTNCLSVRMFVDVMGDFSSFWIIAISMLFLFWLICCATNVVESVVSVREWLFWSFLTWFASDFAMLEISSFDVLQSFSLLLNNTSWSSTNEYVFLWYLTYVSIQDFFSSLFRPESTYHQFFISTSAIRSSQSTTQWISEWKIVYLIRWRRKTRGKKHILTLSPSNSLRSLAIVYLFFPFIFIGSTSKNEEVRVHKQSTCSFISKE